MVFRGIDALSTTEVDEMAGFLAKNALSNVYLLSDLELRDRRASFLYSRNNGSIDGVSVRLRLPEYPIIWILGSFRPDEPLTELIPDKKFVMITDDTSFLKEYPEWKSSLTYREHVMKLDFPRRREFSSGNVKFLREDDAEILARNLADSEEISTEIIEEARDMISRNDMFCYILDKRIVSRGIVAAKSKFGWALGGMYTAEEHRGKGYATSVMSEMVSYASRHTDGIVLYVRDDNLPALRSYEKIGFRTITDRYFIDHNTGVVP